MIWIDMLVLPVMVCVLGPYFSGLQETLVDAYLARLQLCRCAPTLQSLQSLLAAHVDRVSEAFLELESRKPFSRISSRLYPAGSTGVIYENLDLQLRRPLPPLCFEESVKRVAKGRGGHLTCREGFRDER